MTQIFDAIRKRMPRLGSTGAPVAKPPSARGWAQRPPVDIAPDDPLVAYFLDTPGAVELDRLRLDSPALTALKAAGVAIAIPLVSQGELVGVLNLGPRLSQQDYSSDDRGLLNTLASQAAPAVRVAQLVRQQQIETRERERIEQELRVARLIQQTLLPKELPDIPGWQLAAYYQPARAVGGDFYDFLPFTDGRLGIVIGDVTDKGVPAALVMATTRSILRTAAQEGEATPGAVLARANDLLFPDIPPKMFVTCLYGILNPHTGALVYANAGHDLPHQRQEGGAVELRATGMPLGLMPGMSYEERETLLAPGDSVLFYSDGLVEAHNPENDMFGFPKLMTLMSDWTDTTPLIERMLNELAAFTGVGWEQEDDVTLVTLQRERMVLAARTLDSDDNAEEWRALGEYETPSQPGNERDVLAWMEPVIGPLGLTRKRVEELKTAVAEATMNAMEHGNQYQADKPVVVSVSASPTTIRVSIRDHGGDRVIPEAHTPDIEAKLAELQTPRGWGLFLIKSLVDDIHDTSDGEFHVLELLMSREGEQHASQTA
ncbi:MAG: SpoIIE family protein phosphatase [Chloroflexota bacterium]|nr:SpoIIE family protein phosphatase [Chloroflexota bacterium]